MSNTINNSLGLGPIQPSNNSVAMAIIKAKMNDDSAMEDFKFSRLNLYDIIQNAGDAIIKLSELANASQDIKAFEAIAKLTDSAVKANEALLNSHEKIKKMEKATEPNNEAGKVTNNNLFVASTAEIAEYINKRNGK